MKNYLLTFFFFGIALPGLFAQTPINITPQPASLKTGKGNFIINSNTVIVLKGSNLEKIAGYFNEYLRKHYGFILRTGNQKSNTITLNFERIDHLIPGAYNLTVGKNGININGDNEAGVFYGIQTLIQLLPAKQGQSFKIPQLLINDHPRFEYRGMHLDVARHFFSVEYVKKYMDYLALHKFNNFHWHLTDDQGWRIEIKKYPKLTEVGGCRDQTLSGRFGSDTYDGKKYCGYYTQEEIKEVVQYAADRYINIIPEIDVPGHSLSALASYHRYRC